MHFLQPKATTIIIDPLAAQQASDIETLKAQMALILPYMRQLEADKKQLQEKLESKELEAKERKELPA
jgi:hypothetical protein